MKRTLLFLFILLMAACTSQTDTELDNVDPLPVTLPAQPAVVETAVPQPAAETAVPQPVTAGDSGVSFQYDPSLAGSIAWAVQPARGGDPFIDFGYEFRPDFLEANFVDNYAADWTVHRTAVNLSTQPQLLIFPVDAFIGTSSIAGDQIAALQTLLADQPAEPVALLPYLPAPNAQQLVQVHMQYLSFQNGTGVRYLTQYTQEVEQVSNQGIFYTFQGLTNDGRYYISAAFPVQADILPADGWGESPEDLWERMPEYLAQITADLNAVPASEFHPDLAKLDAIVQSLAAAPTVTLNAATIIDYRDVVDETDVQYVLANTDIDMYGGPGIEYEVIGFLAGGQIALVTGINPNASWWRVICPDDTIGSCWVAADPDMTQPTTAPGG